MKKELEEKLWLGKNYKDEEGNDYYEASRVKAFIDEHFVEKEEFKKKLTVESDGQLYILKFNDEQKNILPITDIVYEVLQQQNLYTKEQVLEMIGEVYVKDLPEIPDYPDDIGWHVGSGFNQALDEIRDKLK